MKRPAIRIWRHRYGWACEAPGQGAGVVTTRKAARAFRADCIATRPGPPYVLIRVDRPA